MDGWMDGWTDGANCKALRLTPPYTSLAALWLEFKADWPQAAMNWIPHKSVGEYCSWHLGAWQLAAAQRVYTFTMKRPGKVQQLLSKAADTEVPNW